MTEPLLRCATQRDIEGIANLLSSVFLYDGYSIVQTADEIEEEFIAPHCTIEHDVMVVECEEALAGVAEADRCSC